MTKRRTKTERLSAPAATKQSGQSAQFVPSAPGLKHESLTIEILFAGDDKNQEPPKEFRIFASGLVETRKGTFKFTEASGRRCMEKAAEYGNDYAIDYAHAMLNPFANDPAESGKAAGWFKCDVRNGALWASDVRWTPKARQMLIDKEYRYISPAFERDEAGEIQSLLNVALTNIPATNNLAPLMASQNAVDATPPEAPKMKYLITLLGLSENATEAEVAAAVQKIIAGSTQLLSFTGKSNASEALGIVQAWKLDAEKLSVATTELASMKAANAKAEVEGLVKEALSARKLTPAQEPWAREMGAKDIGMFKAFLSVATPVLSTNPATEPSQTSLTTLSAEETAVAAQMGVDLKKLAEVKAQGMKRSEKSA